MIVACPPPTIDPQPAFLQWLEQAGVQFSGCLIATDGSGERKIHLGKAVRRDERTINVPRRAVMCSDKARIWFIAQKVPADVVETLSNHALLAAWILAEKADPASPWLPYLHMLPTSFPDVPLFYPEFLRRRLLGTTAGLRLEERHHTIKSDYLLLRQAAPFFAQFTLPQFQWAMTVVGSRCFSLSPAGQPQVLGLVPLMDLVNHRATATHHWTYDADHQTFSCTAKGPLCVGQEMTLPYGEKTNQRFWLHYGFVDADRDGWCADLVVQPDENDSYREAKAAMIAELGGPSFAVDGAEAFESLALVLRALRCRNGDWDDYAVRYSVRAGTILDRDLERRVLSSLTDLCRETLAALPLCEPGSTANPNADARLSMVNRIIVGERAVLQKIAAFAAAAQSALEADASAADGCGSNPTQTMSQPSAFPEFWLRMWRAGLPSICPADQTVRADPVVAKFSRLGLTTVTDKDWPELLRLRVRSEQDVFVPSPSAVLRARVFQKQSPLQVVAIRLDGRIVGMFTSQVRSADHLWFAHFVVDQSVQGRGIGRWAFRSYLDTLRAGGYCGFLGLNVHRKNEAMIRFYTRVGFQFDPNQDSGEHLGMQYLFCS